MKEMNGKVTLKEVKTDRRKRGGREQITKTEDNEKKKGKCMVAEE